MHDEFSIAEYISDKHEALQLALDHDLSSALLEEEVKYAAEDKAAEVNKAGVEAQIEFLIECLGHKTVLALIKDLIDE